MRKKPATCHGFSQSLARFYITFFCLQLDDADSGRVDAETQLPADSGTSATSRSEPEQRFPTASAARSATPARQCTATPSPTPAAPAPAQSPPAPQPPPGNLPTRTSSLVTSYSCELTRRCRRSLHPSPHNRTTSKTDIRSASRRSSRRRTSLSTRTTSRLPRNNRNESPVAARWRRTKVLVSFIHVTVQLRFLLGYTLN